MWEGNLPPVWHDRSLHWGVGRVWDEDPYFQASKHSDMRSSERENFSRAQHPLFGKGKVANRCLAWIKGINKWKKQATKTIQMERYIIDSLLKGTLCSMNTYHQGAPGLHHIPPVPCLGLQRSRRCGPLPTGEQPPKVRGKWGVGIPSFQCQIQVRDGVRCRKWILNEASQGDSWWRWRSNGGVDPGLHASKGRQGLGNGVC